LPDTSTPEKPCTVPAAQGFSVLYKNRYLYSRYSPDKSILQTIQKLSILPGTMIFCFSPCLWYGLGELLAKLPQDCFVLAYEADLPLYDYARDKLSGRKYDERIIFIHPEQAVSIPQILQNSYNNQQNDMACFPQPGTIRRLFRIDFSAGIQFSTTMYDNFFSTCTDAIARFWKNRLTLIKFGRLYSRNLFHNLARLPDSIPLCSLMHTVSKPVLVTGAGESLLHTIQILGSDVSKFYIICVDAALPSLLQYHITPDAVTGIESQLAIEKAYIGTETAEHPFLFLADMVSRPHIPDMLNCSISWFISAYDNSSFLKNLSAAQILPQIIKPMGSVGLVAAQLAVMLRKSTDIPIFITGLDFSYTAGITHACGTPAHTKRLIETFRLNPIPDYRTAFAYGTKHITGKNGQPMITTVSLSGYARSFTDFFSGAENIFDLGISGLPLGIPQLPEITVKRFAAVLQQACSDSFLLQKPLPESGCTGKINSYYTREEKALQKLKQLLIYGNGKNDSDLKAEIMELLRERDYLYLHFPDGYKISADTGFLKRVRTEIDFFIKDIKTAREILNRPKKNIRHSRIRN
jgi:hypothetical protein